MTVQLWKDWKIVACLKRSIFSEKNIAAIRILEQCLFDKHDQSGVVLPYRTTPHLVKSKHNISTFTDQLSFIVVQICVPFTAAKHGYHVATESTMNCMPVYFMWGHVTGQYKTAISNTASNVQQNDWKGNNQGIWMAKSMSRLEGCSASYYMMGCS